MEFDADLCLRHALILHTREKGRESAPFSGLRCLAILLDFLFLVQGRLREAGNDPTLRQRPLGRSAHVITSRWSWRIFLLATTPQSVP